jgi:hypothetical protein
VEPGELDLALVNGSVICGPASKGADWRRHDRFDPGRGRFGDLLLSEGRLPEQVDHTRIGWRSVRLLNATGGVLDVLDIVPPDDAPHEHEVYIEGIAQPLRLVIQRVPPDKAGRAAKRVRRKAAKIPNQINI